MDSLWFGGMAFSEQWDIRWGYWSQIDDGASITVKYHGHLISSTLDLKVAASTTDAVYFKELSMLYENYS